MNGIPNDFELDNDQFDGQELHASLELDGESSTKDAQAPFDLLEIGAEHSVGTLEKQSVGWYDPRARGGRMLDVHE